MRSLGPMLWGIALVLIGLLFLAQELSNGAFDAGEFIGRAWPLLLIILGGILLIGAVGRRSSDPAESWSTDVGALDRAAVVIEFGAGTLIVSAGTPGKLVDGTFGGGVQARVDDGQVRLRPGLEAWGWWPFGPDWRAREWRVGLTPEIPLSLRVDGGASRNELDLMDLKVTDLQLRTGASDSRIRVPRSGVCRVRIEAGAASVRVTVPDGVSARIKGRLAVGSTDVDTRRFPRALDGWASPDVDAAPNRVEIAIAGGAGSVRVE